MSTTAEEHLEEELRKWHMVRPAGFTASPAKKDGGRQLMKWECGIPGLKGTSWGEKLYKLVLEFPIDFPASPPKCTFTPPIFHPNVSPTGTVHASFLNHDEHGWKPHISISLILVSVQSLLYRPKSKDPVNEEAGKMITKSLNEYYNRIKLNPFSEHAASSQTRAKVYKKLKNTNTGKEEKNVVSSQKEFKGCMNTQKTLAGKSKTVLSQAHVQSCKEPQDTITGNKDENVVEAKGCEESQKTFTGNENSNGMSFDIDVPYFNMSQEPVAENGNASAVLTEPVTQYSNEAQSTDTGSEEANATSTESDSNSSEGGQNTTEGTREAKAA